MATTIGLVVCFNNFKKYPLFCLRIAFKIIVWPYENFKNVDAELRFGVIYYGR